MNLRKKSSYLFVAFFLGVILSGSFASAVWDDPTSQYRRCFVIPSSQVPATTTNYTDYVNLTKLNTTDFFTKTRPDGNDIRFYQNGAKLAREKAVFNSTNTTGQFHVNVNISATSNTTVCMYYGNSSNTDGNDRVAWRAAYKGVYHMETDPSLAVAPDSSQNNGNFTLSGFSATDFYSVWIDKGYFFDNVDNYGQSSAMNTSGNLSLESWIKINASVEDYIFNAQAGGNIEGFSFGIRNNASWFKVRNSAGTDHEVVTNRLNVGQLYHIVGVFNGTHIAVFIDGVYNSSTAFVGSFTGFQTNLFMGVRTGLSATTFYDGLLDEARIVHEALSPSLIATDYNNQKNESQFNLFGSEESINNRVTFNSPTNTTYYGNTSIFLNFTVQGTNPTFNCTSTLGSSSFTNNSLANGTNVINTFNNVSAKSNTINVSCVDSTNVTFSDTISFYIFQGLNLTVVNGGNATALTNWGVSITNGTSNYNTGQVNNNSLLLEFDTIPYGSVTVTFFKDKYANKSFSATNSNTTFNHINGTLWPYQYWYLRDAATSAYLTSFSALFNKSGTTISYSTTTGELNISLEDFFTGGVTGNIVATFSAFTYNSSVRNYNINGSSMINETIDMGRTNLTIRVYDERSPTTQLTVNITISNGTNTTTYTNVTTLALNYLDTANGNITITAVDYNGLYVARTTNLLFTNSTSQNISMYLLKSTEGIYYAFVVTDFNSVPIPNAIVTANRQIGSAFIPMEIRTTDTTGTANFFLDYTAIYQIEVEANGYTSVIFSLQPSTINRVTYVRLQATGVAGANLSNVTTVYDDISYQILPQSTLQNTSFNISFYISSSTSALTNFGMAVYFRNGTNVSQPRILVFNMTLTTPAGATIIHNASNGTGWYEIEAFFIKTGYPQYNITKAYYLFGGQGLGNYNPSALTFSMSFLQMIAVLVTLLATALFTRFGVESGLAAGLTVLALFTWGFGIIHWTWWAGTFLVSMALVVIKNVF